MHHAYRRNLIRIALKYGHVAGEALIDRYLSKRPPWQDPGPLLRHKVVTEAAHVFITTKESVHKGCEPFLTNHDRPGQALSLAMDGAAEHTTHHLIHHPVVRAALVIALLKPFRQQQASDEISKCDVAASQL